MANNPTLGGSFTFQITGTVNGSTWDMTGWTVTFVFVPPASSGASPVVATATVSGTPGIANYTTVGGTLNLTTGTVSGGDLSVPGAWVLSAFAQQGSQLR